MNVSLLSIKSFIKIDAIRRATICYWNFAFPKTVNYRI